MRHLSSFLFYFILVLFLTVANGTKAQVKYIERSWDATNKKVVSTENTLSGSPIDNGDNPSEGQYKELSGSAPDEWFQMGGYNNAIAEYYVVKGDVSRKTVNVLGKDVHLILCDGATLTITGGVKLEGEHKLSIHSQSYGDDMGKMVVTNSYKKAAGIGSSASSNKKPNYVGELVVYGGHITVTGSEYAAGIGSGANRNDYHQQDEKVCNSVTVYGGYVNATGGHSGAGIGGGSGNHSDGVNGGTLTIYDGTVIAQGGKYASGVGGGGGFAGFKPSDNPTDGGFGGTVNVYGGTLTATGGSDGAGIGSGNAELSTPYAYKLIGGEVNIFDGTVTATGGKYGAGIGGGDGCGGATVNIYGGTVTATGGIDAAGIGGGEDGFGGVLNVSGGIVIAKGTDCGSGIGGGQDRKGGNVTITGGLVIAEAGDEEEGTGAISSGWGNDDQGTLVIVANMRVSAGKNADNIERTFTESERINACRYRHYARIEPCRHTTPTVGSDHTMAVTYTSDNDTHTLHCRYCASTPQEDHTFVDNVCACGKREDTNDDMWSVTLHRASTAGSYSYADRVVMMVVKGQAFTIPAVSATEGLTLMGYATSWIESDGIEMKDGETLTAVGEVVTPGADINYYPRYRYRYVPTWTWNDDDATATLSIVCSALSSEAVNVNDITYTTDGDVKTATGTYVHNGATYTFNDTYLLPLEEPIVLFEAASNEDTINKYRGRKVKTLMLNGRTLYEDGSWNTLCLPFDISEDNVYTKLYYPSALKTLSTSDFDSMTGTLTLNFTDATSIEAGKPYLIKWTSGPGIKNLIINNVIISDEYKDVDTDYVNFCGFFSPLTLEANDRSVLYLGTDNKLYYPSADVKVGSCRAVFMLKNIIASDLANQARAFVLNFDDSSEPSAISTVTASNGPAADAIYTIDGRRLNGMPTQRGLYIVNGRKIVIK